MYFFGVLLALAAGIFFGIIGPMTKFAYNAGATVEQAIFFRFIIASLIVLPLVPFQKNLIKNYYNNFKNFIIISIGSILLTSGLLISFTLIDVSLAVLIFCLYPIYVLLFSIFFDKEKIKLVIKLLFLTTFIGLIFVLGPSLNIPNILGILCAFIASLGSATMIITNQKISKKQISPIQINIFVNFINCIFFYLILSLFFSLTVFLKLNIFILILLPAISYSIALLSQFFAIPKIGQSNTALFLYLEPVVGVLGAYYLLREELELYQIIGALVVIISLLLASIINNKIKNVAS